MVRLLQRPIAYRFFSEGPKKNATRISNNCWGIGSNAHRPDHHTQPMAMHQIQTLC